MTPADKEAVREAARAVSLSWEAAGEAARALAGAAAGAAAREAAGATNEIQGAAVIRANNQPFAFLPLFGFSDPESVITSSI